jgi:prepilin-type N-terminal cleavage/methylation domain-containing protein
MRLFLPKHKSRCLRSGTLPMSFSGAENGFTLIEIAVVILLISIMLLVAVPRLPDSSLTDQTRKTKRWVILKVQDLKERAVQDQKTYTLHVGIDSKQLWVTSDDMSDESKEQAEKNAFKLDEDLKVLDVEYPGDQSVESGRADISFFAKGYSDRAIIHMADNDGRFSFQIEPFLSNVKLYDAYTGFEE